MADKIVTNAQEFREAAAEHDMTVKYNGRTLLVQCWIYTIIDPQILSQRVRETAGGPGLRMTFGGLQRIPGGYLAKSFINTDEAEQVVADRMAAIEPKPKKVIVGVVSPTEAQQLWAALHRTADGGD
jgi:hypothetical protein